MREDYKHFKDLVKTSAIIIGISAFYVVFILFVIWETPGKTNLVPEILEKVIWIGLGFIGLRFAALAVIDRYFDRDEGGEPDEPCEECSRESTGKWGVTEL